MHGTGWFVFNLILFYALGLTYAVRVVRYNRRTRISRLTCGLFATASLIWGTGWLLKLLDSKSAESLFKNIGALLFIVSAISMAFGSTDNTQTAPDRDR